MMKQLLDTSPDAYLQDHPTCIKSLQKKFPGVELNELIEAVRKAGPGKESIYRFIERRFNICKSVYLSGRRDD